MKVKSFEKPEKQAAELTVSISPEEFENALNEAYKKNKGQINVSGFRKGHAPRKMIENMYGENIFYEDAIEILYPEAFDFAYDQEKFDLVGQPGIKDVSFLDDKSVEIIFQLWLYPTITIEGYKGLSAPKQAVKVLKKDIEEELNRVADRNAREQSVERAAKDGDIVNIDFKGFLNGEAFEGGSGEKFDLTLGSGQFIPGFEAQLVGVKAGETKNVEVTFPEQYAEHLAGKAATFEVKVNEVKERQKPVIDDEFAKDVSEFDTLEEYKASVKEKISEERKNMAKNQFEAEILDKVAELVEGFIPDAMISERIQTAISNYEYRLRGQGMEMATYLNMIGMTMDEFAENMRPGATRDIKLDLAFEEIAKLEGIEVSDKEVEDEYARLAVLYGTKVDDIKESIEEGAVSRQLKLKKAHDLVIEAAVVEKKAAKKEEKKDESAE